jgi:hypothetical protein
MTPTVEMNQPTTLNLIPVMKRRNLITLFIAIFGTPIVVAAEPKYQKVKWLKLDQEPVCPGDLWAAGGQDPNKPERQGEINFNLQMQAVHPMHYNQRAKDIARGNGDYWRPIGLVNVY